MVDTESLVPPGHLLRQVDAAVDFEKLYKIVEPLYSEEEGRRSIDPVVLFKIVLLQHLDGNTSLRGTLRRAQTDGIPVVSAVHAERGAAPFFHGELQLPAPVYFRNHRGSVSMDIGGGGQCGSTDPGGGIYRWDTHQSQRKSEEENEAGSTGSSKTIPGRTAGGGERGPGGSWRKKASRWMMKNEPPQGQLSVVTYTAIFRSEKAPEESKAPGGDDKHDSDPSHTSHRTPPWSLSSRVRAG